MKRLSKNNSILKKNEKIDFMDLDCFRHSSLISSISVYKNHTIYSDMKGSLFYSSDYLLQKKEVSSFSDGKNFIKFSRGDRFGIFGFKNFNTDNKRFGNIYSRD